jgi:hypothetical protein
MLPLISPSRRRLLNRASVLLVLRLPRGPHLFLPPRPRRWLCRLSFPQLHSLPHNNTITT